MTLARSPDIYQRLWSSIAPSISGDYTVDIKKALVCQLLAGSRKVRQSVTARREGPSARQQMLPVRPD